MGIEINVECKHVCEKFKIFQRRTKKKSNNFITYSSFLQRNFPFIFLPSSQDIKAYKVKFDTGSEKEKEKGRQIFNCGTFI